MNLIKLYYFISMIISYDFLVDINYYNDKLILHYFINYNNL